MTFINKRYTIEVEALTPVHIGAGDDKEWKKGADFIQHNGKIYKINLNKIIKEKETVNIDALSTHLLNKDNRRIIRLLQGRIEEVSDKIYTNPFQNNNNINSIKSLIRSQYKEQPMIPGSSLKGALRSIFFKYLKYSNEENEIHIFGDNKEGEDFMRFIKPSDIYFDKTNLINSKIFNLYQENRSWTGGWKNRQDRPCNFNLQEFNTIYEAIMPMEKGNGYLMLSNSLFELLGKTKKISEEKKKKELFDIDTLFHKINAHTKNYLLKEKDFFKRFSNDETEKICNNIDSILQKIEKIDANSCIMKLGAGSGFHSITGDWKFDDYRTNPLGRKRDTNARPKTRKIAIIPPENTISLMGFVKIRYLSEEESIEFENKKRDERIRKEQEIQEIENARIEEDKKREELAKRKKQYDKLIGEGDSFFESKQYKEALSKYQEAEKECPNERGCQEKIAEKKQEIKIIEEAEKLRIEKEKKDKEDEMRREASIQNGIIFLEEKKSDGKYKVHNFKGGQDRINGWIKKAQKNIPEEQDEMLENFLSRIYSNITKPREKKEWQSLDENVWKNVSRWTSPERAKKIFSKIISQENT